MIGDGKGLLTCDNSAVGSPRTTRSRTWCPSGDRPARDASRPDRGSQLQDLDFLPLKDSASLSEYSHTPPSTGRAMERSTTIGANSQPTQTTYASSSEEEFGEYK